MTIAEFNNKYKDYLEDGHYGLSIGIPSVIEYLDDLFEHHLTKVIGFKYFQIKLKFNMARFHSTLDVESTYKIEDRINSLVKIYDNNK